MVDACVELDIVSMGIFFLYTCLCFILSSNSIPESLPVLSWNSIIARWNKNWAANIWNDMFPFNI